MNRYLYPGVLEELEEAQREKAEMDALVAQYGGMSAVEPSLRDQATGYLADGLQAVGLYDSNPRAAARTAGALTGVMDWLPGTGEALAAADAENEFSQGNVGMGVLYAAGALPFVPAGATKAAGKAVKAVKGALEGRDEAADIGDRLHTFHRLSSDNLHHADRMGGMPMPSIGVGRVDAPYDGYGDIELIGPKTMAKPSARNPVFSSDAYSPTYPRVNYRFNEENVGALIDDLAPYTEKIDADPIKLHMDLDDQLGALAYRKDVKAKYLDEKGVELPDDLEGWELDSWMSQQVSRDPEFDAYAREMFNSLDAEERLFFGYTPSGNRRYKPHTLENALKYMKEDMRDNNQTGMFGAGAFRAQVAPTFRTLEDVKAARDRISEPGVLTEMKDKLNNDLIEISSEFSDYAKYTDRNQFIAGDMHRDQLLEIAQGRADWDEYFPGAPEELKQRWTAYMEELKNAPTAYFEAKPQRIVTLDEFQGALIPADAPQEVEDILRRNSIERIERVTDEADRIAKMRKFQDLLFGVTGTAGAAGLLYNEQSDTASL
jgi:hypothetical protein